MHTVRPLKFHKNSFIFLETIFALIVLSFVVSSFFKLTHQQNENGFSLNTIHSIIQFKTAPTLLNTSTQTLQFIKNNNEPYSIKVSQTIYNDGKIKLIQYEK